MERRTAIKNLALSLGVTVTSSTLLSLLQACEQPVQEEVWKPLFLTEQQGKTLAAMVERIIPKTDTPSAKEAGVHQFIDLILKDYTKAEEAQEFADGIDALEQKPLKKYQKVFTDLEVAQQDEFLKAENEALKNVKGTLPFFFKLKKSTIEGYYTSEIGAQTLSYIPVPGDYKGCIDLTPEMKTYSYR